MTENKIHPDDIAAYIQDNGLLKNNIDLANMVNFFAELIVRECANQVDWILAEGGKTQGDLIKQHFGVKQ